MEPFVAVIMGSKSDWDVMSHAVDTLEGFKVPCEARVLSAHRTPDLLAEYIKNAESRGLQAIIAGAGMAAHLAGVAASMTTLPILGVPLSARVLDGMDALLAMVQMPAGIPVATFAIGKAGAINAALFAVSILAKKQPELGTALQQHRQAQHDKLAAQTDPRKEA